MDTTNKTNIKIHYKLIIISLLYIFISIGKKKSNVTQSVEKNDVINKCY